MAILCITDLILGKPKFAPIICIQMSEKAFDLFFVSSFLVFLGAQEYSAIMRCPRYNWIFRSGDDKGGGK